MWPLASWAFNSVEIALIVPALGFEGVIVTAVP